MEIEIIEEIKVLEILDNIRAQAWLNFDFVSKKDKERIYWREMYKQETSKEAIDLREIYEQEKNASEYRSNYKTIIELFKKYIEIFSTYKKKFEIISEECEITLNGVAESRYATGLIKKEHEKIQNSIIVSKDFEGKCEIIINELNRIITEEADVTEDDVILEIGARTKRR